LDLNLICSSAEKILPGMYSISVSLFMNNYKQPSNHATENKPH